MNPDLLHAQPFLLCWAAARAGEMMDLAMVRWADTSSGKPQGHRVMFHPTSSHTPDLPTQFLPFHHSRHRAAFWSPGPHCVPWEHHVLWVGLSMLGTGCLHPHHSPNYRSLRCFQIHTDMSDHYQDLSIKYLARRRQSSHLPSLPPCPGTAGSLLAGTGRRW